jgi:hypothetical protein
LLSAMFFSPEVKIGSNGSSCSTGSSCAGECYKSAPRRGMTMQILEIAHYENR